jgi:hypothetical protein
MRQEQQVALLQFTPGTSISIAQLDKIDRAVEFGSPSKWLNLAHSLIDLNERTGSQKRVKREILEPDIAIQAIAHIQVLKKSNWHFPPNLNHSSQEVRILEVEGAVKSHREGDGLLRIVYFQRGQMRIRQRR